MYLIVPISLGLHRNVVYGAKSFQLQSLMVPIAGSEPLAFKSIYAASGTLQARACTQRAFKQVHLREEERRDFTVRQLALAQLSD